MPLFCRKKEMGAAAGTRGKFARGCRKEIRRREEKIAENAGSEMHFRRKSADHEKIPVSSPEWKEKLPWLETERDCRIHVGVADRRGRELRF